jgi:hypothetical protein
MEVIEKQDLDFLVEDMARRYRTSSPEEIRKVFGYLNQQLAEKDLKGIVTTLLVRDSIRRSINCYGLRIEHGADEKRPHSLFEKLNMSIDAPGGKMAASVSYPQIFRVTSYQKGYFVEGIDFYIKRQAKKKKSWVALVNIPVDVADPEMVAYRFP